ncbi:hypothetical protein GCM10010503_63360 [Streptomyces lucensis JCM 4490]|uniref:Uncharacterized protein n=1 Tax=Streptomyces lucensis JCM 4490 TaxID=1306176 RepID=A0A918JI49_9ACTN|nr:hypothetical protein GCM10010503_63360 [Streptomyces lucensis JCM 4490]
MRPEPGAGEKAVDTRAAGPLASNPHARDRRKEASVMATVILRSPLPVARVCHA